MADIEMLTVALNIHTGELVMLNSGSCSERYKETDPDVDLQREHSKGDRDNVCVGFSGTKGEHLVCSVSDYLLKYCTSFTIV